MEFMANCTDNQYDLAIVDPPYGIGINHNMGRRKGENKSDYKKVGWDDSVPNDDYFDSLFRVSKNCIIWGANYFKMPPTKSFIIWRKPHINEKMFFSMCEYAYTNHDKTSKEWVGMSNDKNRIHPTEKPKELYRWLLDNYANPGDKILDTHGGSGSICIACHDMGFDLDWMELDKDYYEAAKKRYEKHISQIRMF
jgi:site-specific DNA-methyltransferase (adenine-specific)